ncbi:MAG: DUF1674 domain-containing protein [Notoacmeibacter sp.]
MTDENEQRPPLSEVAKRALAEAEARRAAMDAAVATQPKEINGRGGLDPARFGDWEVKGVAIDF